jgi:hypothetical protein
MASIGERLAARVTPSNTFIASTPKWNWGPKIKVDQQSVIRRGRGPNEARLIRVKRNPNKLGWTQRKRLLQGLDVTDYQGELPLPEIGIMSVNDYPAGELLLTENPPDAGLGEIMDDILKYAPWALGGVAVMLLLNYMMTKSSSASAAAPAK